MSDGLDPLSFLRFIVDRVNVGIIVVDKEMEVLLWNHFMAVNSGREAHEVLGNNLFDSFSGLPEKWLRKKINSVFILKNFAFTGWEQRSYLFQFRHNRPVTGSTDFMMQNCTFLPIMGANGEVQAVCITVFDVTDISIYQNQLKDAMAKLEDMSIRDGLTEIYNRRYIETQLAAEFDRCRRYDGTMSAILFDLDHFKNVNDTYGHLAGDEVLRQVSKTLVDVLRTSDVAGRYGGEEFTVILPNTSLEGGMKSAERIRSAIEKLHIVFEGQHIPVTVSIGVTEFRKETKSHEAMLQEADTALYICKENGRNQSRAYDPKDGSE